MERLNKLTMHVANCDNMECQYHADASIDCEACQACFEEEQEALN